MRRANNGRRPAKHAKQPQFRSANSLSTTISSSHGVTGRDSFLITTSGLFTKERLIHLVAAYRSLTREWTGELARELALECARRGDVCCLEALLGQVNIDVIRCVDQDGRTLLSYAAGNGHLAMVSYLIERFPWDSCFFQERDKWGRTALSRAAGNGHQDVTKFLLDKGYHFHFISDKDVQGRTPLSWAAGNGHLGIAILLVKKSRDSVATVDNFGWTPFNWATKNGHRLVHKFLLSRILADTTLAEHPGPRGLSWISVNGSEKGLLHMLLFDTSGALARAIRDRGITICGVSPTNHSKTPPATRQAFVLTMAAEQGWSDLVQVTLSTHGSVWSQSFEEDSAGVSAISIAVTNDDFPTLLLLLNDGLERLPYICLDRWWKAVSPPILMNGNAQLLDRLWDHGIFSAPTNRLYNACLCRFCQPILEQLVDLLKSSSEMTVSTRRHLEQAGKKVVRCAPVSFMKTLCHRCDMCGFFLLEGRDVLRGKFTGGGMDLVVTRVKDAGLVSSINLSGAMDGVLGYFYRPKDNKTQAMTILNSENLAADFNDCVGLITRWLDSCTREDDNPDHGSCSNHDLDRPLPKRVLKLDFNGREHIKLIECDGYKRGRYVALSHCWGDPKHMDKAKTTTANYQDRLDSIEYSVLPQSFQAAARLCWALGIKYLWIDSICIVQDDPKDWQHESAKMKAIYEDAFITFAATASSGCTEGLKLSYPRPWHFPQQLSVGRVGDLNGLYLDQQPLYKRGWTLQEITLSRRVIHFAADQLYFVCRSRKESAYGQYLGSGRALSRLGPAGGQAERELWWDWVEDYSNRTLTIPEDKLPPFAGLTKKFQQLTGAHPAVGLWMEDIQYRLLWRPAKACYVGRWACCKNVSKRWEYKINRRLLWGVDDI